MGTDHVRKEGEAPIHIQVIEPNPVLRGDVRLPNYFLDFWQPLLGHKATATYAMLLRFAYGTRDECAPSLSRLAASLRMTRQELTGRVRQIKQPDGSIREYQEAGMLDVLVQHDLLTVRTTGHGGSLTYHFKIRRTPPLLTAEQVKRLPSLLQAAHRKLLQACQKDRSLGEPGKVKSSAPEKGGDSVTTAQMCSEDTDFRGVQTLSSPGEDTVTRRVQTLSSRSRHTRHIQKQQQLPSEVVVVLKDSVFEEIQAHHLMPLIDRYGVEKVARYLDVLSWEYRQNGRTVRNPRLLLTRALQAEDFEIPEDYVPYQERLQQEQEARATVEAKRQAEEAERQAEAERRRQAAALFQQLPLEEQEAYRQRALAQIPPAFHGYRTVVDSLLYQLVAQDRLNGRG